LVARERRAAAEEVEPLVDPDAAPCRAGRAAVHGTLQMRSAMLTKALPWPGVVSAPAPGRLLKT
jgi:hypothetical protein